MQNHLQWEGRLLATESLGLRLPDNAEEPALRPFGSWLTLLPKKFRDKRVPGLGGSCWHEGWWAPWAENGTSGYMQAARIWQKSRLFQSPALVISSRVTPVELGHMSAAAGFVFLMWELGHNLVMIGMCSVDEGGTLPGVPQRDVQTGVGSQEGLGGGLDSV